MADEHTIRFVPTRLNAAPVVFRGMTEREIFIVAVFGLVLGVPLGLLLAVTFSQIAFVPTLMFVTTFATLMLGGKALRRLRRGRPETWLYRRMQWAAAHAGLNSAQLIITTETYRHRRDRSFHTGKPL